MNALPCVCSSGPVPAGSLSFFFINEGQGQGAGRCTCATPATPSRNPRPGFHIAKLPKKACRPQRAGRGSHGYNGVVGCRLQRQEAPAGTLPGLCLHGRRYGNPGPDPAAAARLPAGPDVPVRPPHAGGYTASRDWRLPAAPCQVPGTGQGCRACMVPLVRNEPAPF